MLHSPAFQDVGACLFCFYWRLPPPPLASILTCLACVYHRPLYLFLLAQSFHSSLSSFTVFHVYNTPPTTAGTSLGMKLKLSSDKSSWSEKINFVYPLAKEDTVCRVQIPGDKGIASAELEVLKDPADFSGISPPLQRRQQACVISSPR